MHVVRPCSRPMSIPLISRIDFSDYLRIAVALCIITLEFTLRCIVLFLPRMYRMKIAEFIDRSLYHRSEDDEDTQETIPNKRSNLSILMMKSKNTNTPKKFGEIDTKNMLRFR